MSQIITGALPADETNNATNGDCDCIGKDTGSSSQENSSGCEDTEINENKKKKDKKHKKHRKRRKKHHRKQKRSSADVELSSDDDDSDGDGDTHQSNEMKSKKDILMDKITEILEEEEHKIHSENQKKNDTVASDCEKKSIDSSSRKDKGEKKFKHSSRSKSRSPVQRRSLSTSRKRSRSKSHTSSRSRSKRGNRSRSRKRSRSRSRKRSRSRSRKRSRSRSRRRGRSRSRKRSRSRDRQRSRSRSRRKIRSRSRSLHQRRRHRSKSESRTRSRSKEKSSDKKRSSPADKNDNLRSSYNTKEEGQTSSLWDVKSVAEPISNSTTRKNSSDAVFQKTSELRRSNIEIKYGNSSLSKSREEKAASINQPPKASPYGNWQTVTKTIDTKTDLKNFTELCLKISAKESFNRYIVDSAESSEEESGKNQSEFSDAIHHPFAVKPAPIIPPQMTNYSKRFSMPLNPAQAIMAGSMNSLTTNPADVITGPLEKHFPVSTGTDHRDKENAVGPKADLPVYEEVVESQEPINVSSIIARRLGAQQRLNANPNDTAAASVLKDCDLKLKGWSDRNKKPGKFTGERGVRMDKKQIAGAIETWVRKDFFHNLQPLTGGIGMQMMQNMGWKQGTPLGKSKEGYVAPISFDVKVGRSGLSSYGEHAVKGGGGYGNHLPKKRLAAVQNVAGKHPVSALAECCTKRKLGPPEYNVVFENGQSHSKNFLMKVTVQNVDYQPTIASPNKKHAKAQAALTALKILGFAGET